VRLKIEQALVIEAQKGLIVITGCAHPGTVRLLQETQKRLKQPIHLVLGGFHLFRNKKSEIDEIVDQLKALKVQIAAPCHCSGSLAIECFQQAFQDRFYKIGTGTVLTLDR
jgi:7,8-dihydropterin-6-yl-methyl-4-(beta-D-ribofuranosyl)aminobenzene 5'-phosphate synthase